jgi:hypothetical protein
MKDSLDSGITSNVVKPHLVRHVRVEMIFPTAFLSRFSRFLKKTGMKNSGLRSPRKCHERRDLPEGKFPTIAV